MKIEDKLTASVINRGKRIVRCRSACQNGTITENQEGV